MTEILATLAMLFTNVTDGVSNFGKVHMDVDVTVNINVNVDQKEEDPYENILNGSDAILPSRMGNK